MDPLPTAGIPSQPLPGYRWVAVELSVRNEDTNPDHPYNDYNELYGRLKASDGKEYRTAIGWQKPALSSGNYALGQTVRGWLTFQIPVSAQPVTFMYAPVGEQRVVFDLTK